MTVFVFLMVNIYVFDWLQCVQKYADGELAVGEMTCVDRCTGKYLHASTIVEDIFKAIEAQSKEQQQLGK